MHSHNHVLLISVLPEQPPQTPQVLIVTILKPENWEIPCETRALFSQPWASALLILLVGEEVGSSKAPRSGVVSPHTTQVHQHPELLFETGTPHFGSIPLIKKGGFATMLKCPPNVPGLSTIWCEEE